MLTNYTAVMLAENFHISQTTAYKLMRLPDFPSVKIFGRWLVEEESLKAWMLRQGKG